MAKASDFVCSLGAGAVSFWGMFDIAHRATYAVVELTGGKMETPMGIVFGVAALASLGAAARIGECVFLERGRYSRPSRNEAAPSG
jgi:hypothetical protein